ncbi:MAG TPA: hypothetical protein VGR11_01760 [Solirubrobacteraceae bacterium]|nr:hypothetical protein [Solirubrobacteraceae bacterium]
MTRAAAGGLDVSLVHVDRLIAVVAAEQDSLITWHQLQALGLGRGAIEHRVRCARLHQIHVGVFCCGVRVDSPWMRGRAAVFAAGAGSVVSHERCCGLLGIRPHPRGPVDITVVGRRVRQAGIRAHRVARLAPDDVRLVRGIPLTSPARTLLDMAPSLTPSELADAVEQAQVKRLVTKRDIARILERAGARAGVRALRAVLDEPAFTRSRAERRLVSLLRAAKLPQPVFNAFAEGYEVDALWRHERVVLEFDSYAFHATKAAFVRDREKSAALERGRHVVLRTTWHELTKESHALIARTAEVLARAADGT